MHVIVTIPKYKSASEIAMRLGMDANLVEQYLLMLVQLGILRRNKNGYELLIADLHIPKHSPMVTMHHNNWRNRAVLDSANLNSDGLHFTSVYSMSQADYQIIKEKMLKLIEESRRIVGPSKEEELVAMTCDIFRV